MSEGTGSEGTRDAPDSPGVIAPPPFIYVGALVVGLAANALGRRGAFASVARAVGWPLVLVGLLVGGLGLRELRRAGTNVDPYRPSTAVVTGGPYRFTRNPLYLGMTLVYCGVAARARALPAFLLLPAVLRLMRRGVIEREERYLERKFGAEYLSYKARVRRWI